MTRHTTTHIEEGRIAFARRAAARFAQDPKLWTYAAGDPEPGELLALRWGLGEDCVLVIRVGDDQPVIFGQIVREALGEVVP
jgi:hypothetical protein